MNAMRPHFLVFLAVIALLIPACKKPAAPEASAPPPTAPTVQVEAATPAAEPANPPPATAVTPPAPTASNLPEPPPTVADQLPTAPVPPAGAQKYDTQLELTSALHHFLEANGRLPNNFQELVAKKFLQKMPVAPPGKRFAIDRINLQVVMVQ